MNKNWFKEAIVYSLDVETFCDSNGDGTGDFHGLTKKLDYLYQLGVNCIWLLPFYPSPQRDNGYDVMDYYGIDPQLGTLGDFAEFIEEANALNIKVIVDLVVNHTSNKHPWFNMARCDKNSKYKNYYIWSKEKPQNTPWDVAFEGKQEHIWTYDDVAGEYYLHRFYSEQPELNIANPEVKKEFKRIMEFWLKMGVSGFRLDAVHMLIDLEHLNNKNMQDLGILNMIHDVSSQFGEIMLLAEANDEPDELLKYFGKGNRMNHLFNFLLNQYMFLSLAKENVGPIEQKCKLMSLQPAYGQWLNFIRHHDELTLDKLSKEEVEEIFKAFAPNENMRIFKKGIRRRLPPMLKNNRKKIELVYSFIFSIPGIPLIRYGDEIGMGDDLSLPGRESVRTVMQWSSQKNGGFSFADSEKLIKPVISEGEYSFSNVNVENQLQYPGSFLVWVKNLIMARKKCTEIKTGIFSLLDISNDKILAHQIVGEDYAFIAFHNFSGENINFDVKIDLKNAEHLFRDQTSGSNLNELSPYGYRWLILPR